MISKILFEVYKIANNKLIFCNYYINFVTIEYDFTYVKLFLRLIEYYDATKYDAWFCKTRGKTRGAVFLVYIRTSGEPPNTQKHHTSNSKSSSLTTIKKAIGGCVAFWHAESRRRLMHFCIRDTTGGDLNTGELAVGLQSKSEFA